MEEKPGTKVANHAKAKDGRIRWSRKAEFLLSCIGYAVGLSNIWRFPYLCMRNGGGAFLVPYFLSLLFVGLPLFYMEIAIGQYGSASPITMWKLCPLFKGVGWCVIIVNIAYATYYSTLTTWIFYYLYSSFHSVLPWTTCDNDWNTDKCLSRFLTLNSTNGSLSYNNHSDLSLSYRNQSIPSLISSNQSDSSHQFVEKNDTLKFVSPSEEFWHHKVLQLSDGIGNPDGLRWPLVLCHFIGWSILALILLKGIRSAGKVVYATVTLPVLFLTILLVRGVTLPGSLAGVLYYITPVWSRLAEPRIWAEAALQLVFHSLGPGWGVMINFASHNNFKNDVRRDAILISLVNSATSFYGGFVVFSVIGYMAHKANVPVDKVITSGPGLAFIVYPEALGSLPLPQLWSVLFFLMLLSLTLDTQFGTVECLLSSVRDEFGYILQTKTRQRIFTATVFVGLTLVSLLFCTRGGMYFFQVVDWFMAAFSVVLVACTEALVISWIYGSNRFFDDIAMMTGSRPSVVFKVLLGVVIPILLLILFVYNCITFTTPSYGDYVYPLWANVFGWSISMAALAPIPIYIVTRLMGTKGTIKERLFKTTRPSPDWGPSCAKEEDCSGADDSELQEFVA